MLGRQGIQVILQSILFKQRQLVRSDEAGMVELESVTLSCDTLELVVDGVEFDEFEQ